MAGLYGTHAKTLWACDFLTRHVWTLGGRVDMYLVVFIHIQSWRIWVSKATAHLNHVCREWKLHYNRERPHSAIDHLPPEHTMDRMAIGSDDPVDVVCTSRLRGLLSSYSRRAA